MAQNTNDCGSASHGYNQPTGLELHCSDNNLPMTGSDLGLIGLVGIFLAIIGATMRLSLRPQRDG